MQQELIQKLLSQRDVLESLPAPELLKQVITVMGRDVIQANSLSAEDVVITDMLHHIDPEFHSFTLDTGRLNPETYDLMGRLTEKYRLNLRVMFPDQSAVENMVREKGINLFYENIENRKLCCRIRKIEPLKRALENYSGWICGLRHEQSQTREQIKKIEIDHGNGGIVKINPLADWTLKQVMDYIATHSLPHNKLYDKGYQSIGCAPCTRALEFGEPERAGRWWWEDPATKECGIHK